MMPLYIHLVLSIGMLLQHLPTTHSLHAHLRSDSALFPNDADDYNYNSQQQQHNDKRFLQSQPPFSTINNILSEITLLLPEASVSSNGLDITITNLICYNVNIQDVQVSKIASSTLQQLDDGTATIDTNVVTVNAIGLTISCNFQWEYEWSILSIVNGAGGGMAILDPSSGASVSLDIASSSAESSSGSSSSSSSSAQPRDVSVNSCDANVQIDELKLDGDGLGAIASIINLFETLVIGMIEEEVNDAICSEVNELGNKDGALVFAIQSNDNMVSYETSDVHASSSGAGWLVLFLLLVTLYSIGCCFCGVVCIGKYRDFISSKAATSKIMDQESMDAVETDENVESQVESAKEAVEDEQKPLN